jgi:hypothetical protein
MKQSNQAKIVNALVRNINLMTFRARLSTEQVVCYRGQTWHYERESDAEIIESVYEVFETYYVVDKMERYESCVLTIRKIDSKWWIFCGEISQYESFNTLKDAKKIAMDCVDKALTFADEESLRLQTEKRALEISAHV